MAPTSSSVSLTRQGTTPIRTKRATESNRRVKRYLQPVDTNLHSYDRTDPFAAINVLRKLLGMLASRIGSCQYKLTADEHKLSLHLLTIVEPFVGLSPSRRTLTRVPIEILDAIVFHIDLKRDLLAIGLTCKRLYDVVFPRHYEYRTIKCKLSSLSVWHHLSVQRSLALNVRTLEVLDERGSIPLLIPSGIVKSDTELESSDDELHLHDKHAKLFMSAMARMTALDKFIWSGCSPIPLDDVWTSLLKLSCLKSVEFRDNQLFSQGIDLDSEESGPSVSRSVLPKVTSVDFQSARSAYGQSKNPSLLRATNMLHACPNLESLNITYTNRRGTTIPSADVFFLYGRWTHLKSLTLTNISCSPDATDAISSFLAVHGILEVLHLDIGRVGGRLSLPPNSLPNLRELKCNKDAAQNILSCSSDRPRPLEILKGVYLGGQASDASLLESLRKHPIKRLELTGFGEFEELKRLIDYAPKLAWLDVGKRGSKTGPVPISSVVDWADLLTQLPDLVAFHGVRFFYEVSEGCQGNSSISLSDRSRVKKNDEVASVLTWKCPKLRRVDHWDENSGKVIVLLKEDDKIRWEIRRVKA